VITYKRVYKQVDSKAEELKRPVYAASAGIRISKQDNRLRFEKPEGKIYLPVGVIDYLVLFPGVEITSTALRFLTKEKRGVVFVNWLGRPVSFVFPELLGSSTANLRALQYRKLTENSKTVELTRELLKEKLSSLRETFKVGETVLERLKGAIAKAESLQELLAVDGQMGKLLYEHLAGEELSGFSFKKRSYHPPEDPVNSVLSSAFWFFYQSVFIQINFKGLDPYMGFFHQRRGTHATLASDLIEVIRPQIVKVVAGLLSEGLFKEEDFERRGRGVYLKREPMKKLINRLVEVEERELLTLKSGTFLKRVLIPELKK